MQGINFEVTMCSDIDDKLMLIVRQQIINIIDVHCTLKSLITNDYMHQQTEMLRIN